MLVITSCFKSDFVSSIPHGLLVMPTSIIHLEEGVWWEGVLGKPALSHFDALSRSSMGACGHCFSTETGCQGGKNLYIPGLLSNTTSLGRLVVCDVVWVVFVVKFVCVWGCGRVC